MITKQSGLRGSMLRVRGALAPALRAADALRGLHDGSFEATVSTIDAKIEQHTMKPKLRKLLYRPSNTRVLEIKPPIDPKTKQPYTPRKPLANVAKADLAQLVRAVETAAHMREVKRIFESVHLSGLSSVPAASAQQLTRRAALAGLFPQLSALVSIHSHLGLCFDVEGAQEYLRAWLTRFDALGKGLHSVERLPAVLKTLNQAVRANKALDAQDDKYLAQFPQFSGLAVAALGVMRRNTAEPTPEQLERYQHLLASYLGVFRGFFDRLSRFEAELAVAAEPGHPKLRAAVSPLRPYAIDLGYVAEGLRAAADEAALDADARAWAATAAADVAALHAQVVAAIDRHAGLYRHQLTAETYKAGARAEAPAEADADAEAA
ncbi:uncharacterized protein V1510DRAFT_429732 [Dipodascopsis tothii]|uniref:uncharacterized protein n=1 Tax=Dipodascopsis tothii TaxID=44089 RepID=UPI0034CEB397